MKTSKIEWTEATWNPSTGCNKVTAGCKHCYAETMAKRLKAMGAPGYENGFEFTLMPERLDMPMRIKKPTKFFVNSMSDLFHEEMPFDYLDRVFDVMRATPQHTYQILTKREKILEEYCKTRDIPDNVWLGVTVEFKKAKHRIDILRNIEARIRFLSVEPLLEDLGELDLTNIHWVIVGGESGPKARPMKPEWALRVMRQCQEQNAAFFFKQWGTWGGDGVRRSKKANGRVLAGQEWNEEPEYDVV
ncbi:phage Gp37/Gp68 family protein [Sphingobacterium sp. DN00404]|uniref:Phage Gp37/Gp68 family protein n=1 Tax=Sphingobacterium micropteri TaxID=2763501 RepID=A0ABR7YJV2_9SPHI|nr:phage Gp37/Gp68 family protein [Sphingobacterium micropteri]MBD1431597.1 phage Gp37/Gp68 family protein [Sphingobacterium micropteri]